MRFASNIIDQPSHPVITARSQRSLSEHACRLCGTKLYQDLLDLGPVPAFDGTLPDNAQPDNTMPDMPMQRLRIRVCHACTLVQSCGTLENLAHQDNTSGHGIRPASTRRVDRQDALAASLIHKWRITPGTRVVQIGSGDGMLLHRLAEAGAAVLAIDTDAPPDCAIPTERVPFSAEAAMDLAVRRGRADVVLVEGVLPCALDLFDFAAGLASIVRPNGVVAITVPHILPILQHLQFDAFRHDLGAYFSLKALERLLCSVSLRVFDAERLSEDGGLLRVYACPTAARFSARPGLKSVRTAETLAESDTPGLYSGFSARVIAARNQIREFVAVRQAAGRRVAAYGAMPRAGMLLNICGLTSKEIARAAEEEPAPFGRLLPGSLVPIVPVQSIRDNPPDDLLILPWHCAHDVAARLQPLRHRGMQCWALLPRIARV